MKVNDAFTLLSEIGAPARLVLHVQLVREAGELLLDALARLGVTLDAEFVRAGIVLHDAGKALHPNELAGPGAQHETAGEKMLLERAIDPRLARVCRSHAQWASIPNCSLEELVIALADKLWKGVRSRALEERLIDDDRCAARSRPVGRVRRTRRCLRGGRGGRR